LPKKNEKICKSLKSYPVASPNCRKKNPTVSR
jgi:hypothetical protein